MTCFDQKVKVAQVVVTASGCIAARDLLAINLRRNGNMLTNGQAKDVIHTGESKAVAE